jgi:hypothetical protein
VGEAPVRSGAEHLGAVVLLAALAALAAAALGDAAGAGRARRARSSTTCAARPSTATR